MSKEHFQFVYGHGPLKFTDGSKVTRNPKASETMAASSSASKPKTDFRKGDEVATIAGGTVVFGTLEHPNKSNPGEWTVNWNDDIWGTPVPKKAFESNIVVTDRAIYRGCKVKRADKSTDLVGVCRSVTLTTDIRIVGTSTILPSVNSSDLTHLKEFKQKSVVYERGWLGVITDVDRIAKVRFCGGAIYTHPLNDLFKASRFAIESPWVNEGVICSMVSFKKSKNQSDPPPLPVDELHEAVQESKATSTEQVQSHQRICIEDVEVKSVKVNWRFQVDLMCPDAPPSTYKGERLKSLKIVKEDFCTESGFHVGNLCRYKIRTDNEFKSWTDFDKRLAQEYFPSRMDELHANVTSNRAYDKDPESRIAPEKICVVELVHLTGTADIIWQDGTMEFLRSMDLVVLEESLIDNVLIPGDFLFSRDLHRKAEDVYCVVQRTDLQKKLVYMKLLTCTSPPQVLDYNLCLPELSVIPHPRYKYFNETNTVAVMSFPGGNRVGHVQGTNLSGKVSIRWKDSGKDEWCWPAECSIFSVKGCDLDCIVNLVIGEDEVSQEPKAKLQVVIKRLEEINSAWKDSKDYDTSYLAQSIVKLKCLISDLVSLELTLGVKGEYFSPENISDSKTQKMTSLCADHIERGHDCPELVLLMEACTSQLLSECSSAVEYLSSETCNAAAGDNLPITDSASSSQPQTSKETGGADVQHVGEHDTSLVSTSRQESNEHLMEVDDSAIETDCSSPPSPAVPEEDNHCPLAQFPDCFRPNVVVEEEFPEGHVFAKSLFEPQHLRYFTKVVKDELNNLRDSCPPGIKVKAFGNRFDLFSIMICGPVNTPYENSLYLFDASLPPTYPSIPPKFHFHSYRAGRLNPNLYAEGKVCVSLLGTWAGTSQTERWTKESNITQVLLSIQALILVNEPFHNEPGLEAERSTPQENRRSCLAYNIQLLPKIVLMMCNQIKSPTEPWKEEINAFYKENIPKFVARWRKWLALPEGKCKTVRDFNAALKEEDRPGFAIFPYSSPFRTTMKSNLKTLEDLHKSLCGEKGETPPTQRTPEQPESMDVGGES